MVVLLIWSVIYFCWRGYKRTKRRLEKSKQERTQKTITNFEKSVAKRRRQNRKRCCLIGFLRLRRVQSLVCIYSLVFTVLSLVYLSRVWTHATSALQGYRVADCAFHRILQYIEKGAPQFELLSKEEIESLPGSSTTAGYLGLNGHIYYLQTLSNNFSDIPDQNSLDPKSILERVTQLKSSYSNFFNLTHNDYKIVSCTTPGEKVFSDVIEEFQVD